MNAILVANTNGKILIMDKKYDINSDSIFTPSDYADIIKNIADLNTETQDLSCSYKAEIIISYLKDHKIKSIWFDANPELVRFLRSARHLSQLELLFESCKTYKLFSEDVENHIRNNISL